jgi:acetyl esterase/lipase
MVADEASLDPFDPHAVSAETRAISDRLTAAMAIIPRWQDVGPVAARRMRVDGTGPFPIPTKSDRAEEFTIASPGGPIALRLIAPHETPRGVYLHIHGGGWVLGAANLQDQALEALADRTGYCCLSVEYRLAPEHRFPAAVDDCVAAARWLAAKTPDRFGTDRLAIGGESAGAHLALLTLLALRDAGEAARFSHANLVSGFFDLALTPSARLAGDEGPVIGTGTCRDFVSAFLGDEPDPTRPDVSPLYADLAGMPPTLISVGTNDPLLDDSLFLHARLTAVGTRSQLAVYPGGVHGFMLFPGHLASAALDRIVAFLDD